MTLFETLSELEDEIVKRFPHLVTLQYTPDSFRVEANWLTEHFGPDAAQFKDYADDDDRWSFYSSRRWSEGAERDTNDRRYHAFRFRDANDAILFKLARG